MRRFPHGGEVLGASPAHPLLAPVLRYEMVLSRQQALIDLQAIQRIPGLVGYWSADPAYLFEDSGATTPATLNGVVGCWTSVGPAALQATTAVKPYLRKTPVSNVYWLDSNTATSALTATLGNLGSACTVAQAGAEGVAFTENVTISSTYNIAPAFGFNGDVAIFNRALTASENALLTRYMSRGVPVLGSNLVTNGTFDTDTTGWVARSPYTAPTTTVTNGVVRITSNGVDAFGALVQVPIIAAATNRQFYGAGRLKLVSGANAILRVTNSLNQSKSPYFINNTTSFISVNFAAVHDSAFGSGIGVLLGNTESTGVAEFDDITFKEIL